MKASSGPGADLRNRPLDHAPLEVGQIISVHADAESKSGSNGKLLTKAAAIACSACMLHRRVMARFLRPDSYSMYCGRICLFADYPVNRVQGIVAITSCSARGRTEERNAGPVCQSRARQLCR